MENMSFRNVETNYAFAPLKLILSIILAYVVLEWWIENGMREIKFAVDLYEYLAYFVASITYYNWLYSRLFS